MRLITILYLVFLAAPVALLGLGSFGESWSNTLLPSGFTTRWFVEVASDPSFRRAFTTSLQVVALTCILNVLIGLPLAYAIQAGARGGVRIAARLVTFLPVAVPELVLAFGFILVFSSDALPWLGSFWLLAAGHLVLTLPYTVTALIADMDQLGLDDYEHAAATLGASFLMRFRDVTLPLLGTSLLSSTLTVAALSIGEFQLSNLISGFLSRTYPVVLLQAFYGATGFACAATIVLLLLATIASLASSVTAQVAGAGKGRAAA
ncbi:ABC transporter permease subunit [Bradyrhizobium sp. U87765 SZCCT0131]|uniref:ABC transporter permease n=1 Tax=unclassified Bradyrhizobium TaxID=2631580 RepID=UPI001BA79399|nr:ABC transporter permease subunit [Bradyrhizobium sp. U87765 SZCCT0131]MBR1259359.1 ABC transporter permease subunit [Bradyrhizobium sp. U87765 SZCCT0134]MBR1305500.1 ABC transporter permease subunit [Bradyrhizobium sp. U87765 SZCCT0110]MBR1321867.1 ABC transporter permease subunit [Bradyrhizobium sp. U87765 SZCCT0109]MBR1350855.1 ABC transporter permease subunit [Bradyrhizobium sp. U87765 SZCCT0048]